MGHGFSYLGSGGGWGGFRGVSGLGERGGLLGLLGLLGFLALLVWKRGLEKIRDNKEEPGRLSSRYDRLGLSNKVSKV